MKFHPANPTAGRQPLPPVGDEVTSLHSGKVPNSEFRIPNSVRAASRRFLRSWGARLLGLVAGAGLAWAQGTAFSYQGQLTDGAAAANGTYDLNFSLWNAATAGHQQGTTLTQAGVGVTNGLFTATLDFGAQFNGASRWLEIAVRTNGAATFTTLAERQPVLPTPYAIHAATSATAATATSFTGQLAASQITNILSPAQIPNLDANKITGGTFTGNGLGLTNIPVGALVEREHTVVAWGDSSHGQTSIPGSLTNVAKIVGGFNYGMALRPDGTVVAWGDNAAGKATVPVGLTGVVDIAAGNSHSLAVKQNGTVIAWGYNSSGETTVPSSLTPVTEVAAGALFSLALKADGTVVAWGDPLHGQTTVPVGLAQVVSISAGGNHCLALKADGTVVAWGRNGDGQSTVPSGLGGVVAIAAGGSHSLALKANGTVVAWGRNVQGQTNVPIGLNGVTAIAAGSNHSLALKSDGSVVAWGNNFAQLTNVPAVATGVVAIAAGYSSSFAVRQESGPRFAHLDRANTFSGFVTAPGFSGDGSSLTNLNASALSSGTVPVALIPDLDAGKITTGTLAATRIPALDAGKVTTGTFTAAQIPSLDASKITSGVLSPDRIPTLDSSKISGGVFSGNGSGLTNIALGALVQSEAVEVVAWGDNSNGQTNVPSGLGEVVAVAAGDGHSLALKVDGTVIGWGNTSVPAGLTGVKGIAAGWYHSLAVLTNGTVVAWGGNGAGQANVPAGLNGVTAVAAGGLFSLALKSDGTVVAWGGTDSGETNVPVGLNGVTVVAAGGYFSLALKSDGTVVAWGDNTLGQTNVPADLTGVIAVSAGWNHSLALKNDGTVVAWGDANSGQLSVPSDLHGVVQISAGENFNLSLKQDGSVVGWGRMNYAPVSIPLGLPKVAGLAGGWNHSLVICKKESPAMLARLDLANVFEGPISALSFTGNGSGLTSLNASVLSSGTVPAARIPNLDAGKITTGTLADARLSANVALLSGSPAFTSSVRLADTNLFLRGGTDTNHGLAWFGGSRSFAGTTVDGPVLYGYLGGALGSTKNSAKVALRWNDSADVSLGGDLTITNSLSVSSPTGAQVASFTGTRTGNHNSPLVLVENKEGSPESSPAMRVIGRGGADEGALSVSAVSGPIARFGNALNWVATIENNGNLFLSGTVNPPSDRNVKAGFAPVDVEAVLAKVAALPLTTWHYTNDVAATPHLGPMAQDFHAAFGLGGNDKSIATVDADGVALAAIQGLHRKVEALSVENAELRARLERLEALLLNQESRGN